MGRYGARLTAESFERYRQQGVMVVIHSIPEAMVRLAMEDPAVMIASDGILENGKGHPRAAGCYARVLGRYVREQHALPLMDAVRKMTLLPAGRLGLRNKGRIRIGADADLTIFDPTRVIDRATFENPAQYSEGILYVLVNGVPVVKDGVLDEEVTPGLGETPAVTNAASRRMRLWEYTAVQNQINSHSGEYVGLRK